MNLIGTMNNSKFNIIHINCFLQQVCQLARAVFGWGTWGSYEIGGGCAQLCAVARARVGWEGGKGAQAERSAQASRRATATAARGKGRTPNS